MKIYIIDYGMGNLLSVKRAFEKCGAKPVITSDPNDLKSATHIVLPGVGSFADGMENLRAGNWIEAIREAVRDGIPFLGICLGMQLMCSRGYEGGVSEGLDLIKGDVKKMIPQHPDEKIPHVGWNDITKIGAATLFEGIPDGTDFYFVHSYHFIPDDKACIATTTDYCENVVSSIEKDQIFGVQFHPEKSGVSGFKLIKNFISI